MNFIGMPTSGFVLNFSENPISLLMLKQAPTQLSVEQQWVKCVIFFQSYFILKPKRLAEAQTVTVR